MNAQVLISGGGIGGLALAQGLTRHGFDVRLFERNLTGGNAGYRLHMNADGGNALQALLPPDLYQLYQHTSRADPRREQFLMLDEQLRTLGARPHIGPPNVGALRHTAVHRWTLRQILSAGLSNVIEAATVTGYEERGDRVAVLLEDGSTAEGDLLVAADGVNSPIRRQMLPQIRTMDTGLRAIYGRSPLTDDIAQTLQGQLFDGFVVIFSRLLLDNGVLALGAFQPRMPYQEATARFAPQVELSPIEPYMMLGASVPRVVTDRLGIDLDTAAQSDLRRAMRAQVEGWHPDVVGLVERAPESDMFVTAMRYLEPIPPWPSGRVTLLGDAIHAMPPSLGAGANLALRDAALLAERLAEAPDSGPALVRAVAAYEQQMRDYDYPILRKAITREGAASGFTPLGLIRLARLVGPVNLARKALEDRRASFATSPRPVEESGAQP
ncbi:FAD-dependent monooxygenase [Solwaraspora sp. WMMD791]|uniref:FAD-dependent monooxygenase n=1 Tax=Solwaraspora sp. WMMD791 TaxID=3016086 RepID=UPI002499B239|nr:FAD-dependent monooxygenase [Solwaraspora sp. WMMD791]WFE26635.1 FAD-dependent monooxygenase [Solwaraspora sp. WMMD791]